MNGGLGYLGIGYAIVWIVLFGYVLSIQRRQKELERRIEELGDREGEL